MEARRQKDIKKTMENRKTQAQLVDVKGTNKEKNKNQKEKNLNLNKKIHLKAKK